MPTVKLFNRQKALTSVMIDSLTSLAFSVYSGKGVYALLLGSGISRSAAIPTGWEVTIDLIRKIAAAKQVDCGPDPAAWYQAECGAEPDYSDLLEQLARTPAERTNALAAYFEATPEEREENKKTPTSAHRAIARLAAQGYFRVILTTNFDRLMEQALETEGVNPSIISSDDMIHGAAPLVHATVTVIKVHGDYRDTRIRNTQAELSVYTPALDKLLDRVFDEYGLITVGWSATWDHALRNAMLRCPNRRYTTYWGIHGTLTGEAQNLAFARAAAVIPVASADSFFTDLENKVAALVTYDKPHPLSIPLAVASVKRFLVDARFRIELRDLIFEEGERQVATLSMLPLSERPDAQNILKRLVAYEQHVELLLHMVTTGTFFGIDSDQRLFLALTLRLGSIAGFRPRSNSIFEQLALWPSCLVFYAMGVAAVAAGRFDLLNRLLRFSTEKSLNPSKRDLKLYRQLHAPAVINSDWLVPPGQRRIGVTPASDRLAISLREPLKAVLPDQADYEDAFDDFEYLMALFYVKEETKQDGQPPRWIPWGRFMHRGYQLSFLSEGHVILRFEKQMTNQQNQWPPIAAGLFSTVREAADANEFIKKVQMPLIPSF